MIPDELTVVLILKGRDNFTKRWFAYQNKISLPFKILVADGGKDGNLEKDLADKRKYQNLNYEYVKFPYDKDLPTFWKKVHDSLSLVKTKYVMLVANDDFYAIDGIKKAIKFLEKNSDYVASRGEMYTFQVNPDGGEKETLYGKISHLGRMYILESNEAETALERVEVFSKSSASLWQDVHRTEILKECFKALINSGITDLDFAENLLNYLLVTVGKVHRDSGLYMLHQSQPGGLGRVLLKKDVSEWILSDSWAKDMSKSCDLIAERVSQIDKVEIAHARNKVIQYYIAYIIVDNMIKGRMEWRKSSKPKSKIFSFSHVLAKDNKLRIFLKNLYMNREERTAEINSEKFIISSPYKKDFEIIKDFLLNKNGI